MDTMDCTTPRVQQRYLLGVSVVDVFQPPVFFLGFYCMQEHASGVCCLLRGKTRYARVMDVSSATGSVGWRLIISDLAKIPPFFIQSRPTPHNDHYSHQLPASLLSNQLELLQPQHLHSSRRTLSTQEIRLLAPPPNPGPSSPLISLRASSLTEPSQLDARGPPSYINRCSNDLPLHHRPTIPASPTLLLPGLGQHKEKLTKKQSKGEPTVA
jgi:hypothetical protein